MGSLGTSGINNNTINLIRVPIITLEVYSLIKGFRVLWEHLASEVLVQKLGLHGDELRGRFRPSLQQDASLRAAIKDFRAEGLWGLVYLRVNLMALPWVTIWGAIARIAVWI